MGFHHLPVLPDRKGGSVLDVALHQHHPVRLAITPRGCVALFVVAFHLFYAKPGMVQVPLQGGPPEDPRSHKAFHFHDQDNPVH